MNTGHVCSFAEIKARKVIMDRELLTIAFEVKERLRETEHAVEKIIIALADKGPGQADGVPSVPKPGIPALTRADTLLDLKRGEYRWTNPSLVEFPDGSSKQVKYWKEVVIEIVNWHDENGYIAEDTPPRSARRKSPVVSRNRKALPTHGGDPSSYQAEVNGWWVDTWGAVSKSKQKNLIDICRSVGTDPGRFRITIES